MRAIYIVFVLTIGVSLFWGCADDETPTAPRSDPPEFLATVHIDSCIGFPPDRPVTDLCDGSSDIRASFEFVLAGIKEAPTPTTKQITFRSAPAAWKFSDHGCGDDGCSLGDALHSLFQGRQLTIIARRSTSSDDSVAVLSMHLVAGSPAAGYVLSFLFGPVEMSVDATGFPVIDGDMALDGPFIIGIQDGTSVRGSADVTIKNWHVLPVHHKPEPPVIARPTFTPQELRFAFERLKLGEYELAFQEVGAFRPALESGITVSFSIWEQSLRDFDQARLDFLWVVHESGEIWEPEIPSAWDTFRIERLASDGPMWGVGTDVDIVAGFVDLDGEVWLLGTTETIELLDRR